MAAIPKLTPEQWAQVRKTWEADSRKPLAWLIVELALPVSDEGLRLRAKKEKWAKTIEASAKTKVGKAQKVVKAKTKAGKSSKSKHETTHQCLENEGSDALNPPCLPATNVQADKYGLTPNEDRFVAEYLIDLNATAAYKRVHSKVSDGSARTLGARLLAKVNVSKKVAFLKDDRLQRLSIDADAVVEEAYLVGMADTRELVEYRYTCCRHCYGVGFKFQRSQGERDRDFEKHESIQDEREFKAQQSDKPYVRKAFDEKGGTGYLAHKPPNSECVECGGVGVGGVHIKDTSKLSRGAVALYAGVKESKDGLEIKAHDKLGALEKMFKNLGKYELDNKQSADRFVSSDELDALYAGKLREGKAKADLVLGRAKRMNIGKDA